MSQAARQHAEARPTAERRSTPHVFSFGARVTTAALGWLAGVAWHLQWRALPEPAAALVLACVALACAALACRLRSRGALAGVFAAALLSGAAVCAVHGAWRLAQRLPFALEGEDLVIDGTVARLPQRLHHGVRFAFAVDQAAWRGRVVPVPGRVMLGWYDRWPAGNGGKAALPNAAQGRESGWPSLPMESAVAPRSAAPPATRYQAAAAEAGAATPEEAGSLESSVQPGSKPPPARGGSHAGESAPRERMGPGDVVAGDRWRFTVRLRRPHGLRNPHGSDTELHLLEQGIGATGSVRAAAAHPPQRLAAARGALVERLRQHTQQALFATVPDPTAAGVLAVLAYGDQDAIGAADWQTFRDTGVAHLLSISGLHITGLAWLLALAVRRVWSRHGRACLVWPAAGVGHVAGLLGAWGYALFAGWGVPAQRTVCMLAVVTLLHVVGLRWPATLRLLLAAVAVTCADPWALRQPGFWLSFCAVALLMAASDRPDARAADHASGWWDRAHRLARAGLQAQAVATVGMAPLALAFFQQVSWVGYAANLLAIPVFTFLVTPLALLGCLVPFVWVPAAHLVVPSLAALRELAEVAGPGWTVPAAPMWAQVLAVAGGVWVVLPLPWSWRLLAVPLLLPLLLPAPRLLPDGVFELVAVDVGQGSAVIVRTARHLLVYDTGPAWSGDPTANAGDRVLLPLLRARGESRIDRLVVSHRDTDHAGGAAALLRRLDVGELLASLEDGHALLHAASAHRRCAAGQSWQWDGVHFEVLHPPPGDGLRRSASNAASCVVRVRGASGSALLTGDIERAQEAALVAAGARLRSDMLLVPHHGSRTSSTAAFLDAVAPHVAVIQAGHMNRFGHPVREVLDRLRERGVSVVATPSCGAWSWSSDMPASQGRCHRVEASRYWHRDSSPSWVRIAGMTIHPSP